MNQRAKPHAAPAPCPQLRGGPSCAGRSRRVGGSPPEPGRAANSASGAGERGSQPQESRRSSAPTPAPSPHAPRRRHASPHSPRARRLLTLPSPPASAGLQLPLGRAAPTGRPWSPPPSPPPPDARRAQGAPSQVSAARVSPARRQSWLRGEERGRRGGENRGPERSLPLLAGGGGRQPPPRSRGRAREAGALTRPEGTTGPCLQPMEAAAERTAERLWPRAGPRGELVGLAGPSVRPSFLSPLP